MKFFETLEERIKEFFLSRGYTCDGCGAEIFDYPEHRLCEKCTDSMCPNTEKVCPKCGRKTKTEGVCLSCKHRLPRFTKGFSPFVYRGGAASLINRVKNGNPVLAAYFGEEMADYFLQIRKTEETEFLVIPVPLTKDKERERGYNQAEELARSVCRRLKGRGVEAEFRADILQKRRENAPQKEMGYGGRIKNVEGAYHVHIRKDCRERCVLLIDDIMTTGATGSECAARLLAAGAKNVYFLTAVSLEEQR